MIYQFTVHENLPQGSPQPQHRMFDLYNKLADGIKLTREEKDYVADQLKHRTPTGCFRVGGFSAPFHKVLPTILVQQYGNWQEYYAPDKTSLRKSLYGPIEKMTYLDN